MNTQKIAYYLLLFTALMTVSCQEDKAIQHTNPIFENVSPSYSKIHFNNELVVNDSMNFFNYGYFYMGGGVSIGDLNGDDLPDIYFTGNMVDNKLYLNEGDLKFKDITNQSKVAGDDRWMTGSTLIDINTDGKLDIYVSVAGKWTSRKNILYINQGNDENGIPIFKDLAEQYGLADEGFSIQTTFLDYDKDGDLDAFIANYPPTSFNFKTRDYVKLTQKNDPTQSNHLYKNNGDNTFTDVTKESGLSHFGLSIGVIAADFNQDSYTDLYLSNDFHTPDRFFFNNGDGTFTDHLKEAVQHTAFYGMGVDASDINHDGLLDLIQVDMTPADNFRSKANMASMNIPEFWAVVNSGFHYQYMYNSLQLCNGIKPNGIPFYSEVAKLSGLDKTDWSWAPLFADFDNDTYADLYVTNGTRRDINNKDFFKWLERTDISLKIKYKELSFAEATEKMPYKKIDNYMFRNIGNGQFEKANKEWNIQFEGFSNGAAYSDLDNDGDLDLVINNIDSKAVIFKNNAVANTDNNYLKIKLNGPLNNPLGLNAKLTLNTEDSNQYYEHTLTRGFQSSVDPLIHFGLGEESIIKKLQIEWPDGKIKSYENLEANRLFEVNYSDSNVENINREKDEALFVDISQTVKYKHVENDFDDYKREILLPHKMSELGPALAVADINGDGKDDFYIGAARGYRGSVFYQNNKGLFDEKELETDAQYEDVDAVFFDIDKDGDQDLYIVSGGNEKAAGDLSYHDRVYLNDGKGNFEFQKNINAQRRQSGGCVQLIDFDKDGDQDVLVGGRQNPGNYPRYGVSYLLENKSTKDKIILKDVTETQIPELQNLGMVTAMEIEDVDNDGDQDIIVVGEWMPIIVFENQGKYFKQNEKFFDTKSTVGWWNDIRKADFDNDGDMDFVLGNLGLNYKYKANEKESFDIYSNDYDQNEKLDIVLGYYENGDQFPVRGLQCSAEQMPSIEGKFNNKYNAFASANLAKIYTPEKLKGSIHYEARNFANSYIENKGNGDFELRDLPSAVQVSAINAIEILDYNKDGNLDVLIAGNQFESEVETPRNDACFGKLLQGDGKGNFENLPYFQTGLYNPNEVRQLKKIKIADKESFIFANNDAPPYLIQLKK